MPKIETNASPLQLDHAGLKQVVITPETADRFVLQEKNAVAACVSHAQYELFQRAISEKLQSMGQEIVKWADSHKSVVRISIAPREASHFVLAIIVEGAKHNFEIDDAVSDLDVALAKTYPEFPLSIFTFPESQEDSVGAFVNPEASMQIYARTR